MVSQNRSITKNEKDIIEEKKMSEEFTRHIGLSTMFLHNNRYCCQTPFEITFPGGTHLTPRVVAPNNIIVFVMTADGRMSSNQTGGRRSGRNDNNNNNHGATNNTIIPANSMELHMAASRGEIERAREAVGRHRELLWLEEPEGRNLPLHFAVKNGHKEVASYLFREYPQGSYALNRSRVSPIYLAAAHDRRAADLIALVKEMLSHPNIDRNAALEALKNGKSVVRAAIIKQNQEMLRTILKCQPDLIMIHDEEGLTPLSCAASNGFLDIIGYIIKKFPKSITFRNKDGSYPVHKACLGGHVDVLKMFRSKNPRWLLSIDTQGRNILHLAAAERGNKLKHVVSYLLSTPEWKELIKKKDENDRTPLRLAQNSANRDIEGLITSMLQ